MDRASIGDGQTIYQFAPRRAASRRGPEQLLTEGQGRISALASAAELEAMPGPASRRN